MRSKEDSLEIYRIDENDLYYIVSFKDNETIYVLRKKVRGSADDPLSSAEEVVISLCEHIKKSQDIVLDVD